MIRNGNGLYHFDAPRLAVVGFINPNDYPDLGADSIRVPFPTPLYLLPCSSPALGWLTGLIGLIGLAGVNRLIKGKEKE